MDISDLSLCFPYTFTLRGIKVMTLFGVFCIFEIIERFTKRRSSESDEKSRSISWPSVVIDNELDK